MAGVAVVVVIMLGAAAPQALSQKGLPPEKTSVDEATTDQNTDQIIVEFRTTEAATGAA